MCKWLIKTPIYKLVIFISVKWQKSLLKKKMHGQDVSQGQIFKRSFIALNLEFSFSLTRCHIKIKEHSMLYYSPTAGGLIFGCITYSMVLALYKVKTASFRFWTWVAMITLLMTHFFFTALSLSLSLFIYLSR